VVAPSAAISDSASFWNTVVEMSPAGVPCLASSSESWRLHDVQEPQSAEPAKTTSHSFAIASRISRAAGVAAFAFFRWMTRATPQRSTIS
jgi:hypothetical protein